jgi:MFS family permease
VNEVNPRTVQDYLDELPRWPDNTLVADVSLTNMQWRIWGLATAGKFFEGLVVFLTGVALPLMALEFHLGAREKGLVGAASLFGILIGATVLGGLADVAGRKMMFIAEMVIFTIFLSLVSVSTSFSWTIFFLFGMGVALGCDYPTAHLMISESIPSRVRGRLVLSAFGFQAVGALAGTVLGYLILRERDSVSDWRLMYAAAIIPALLVIIGRFFITESPHWHMSVGKTRLAEREMEKLLWRNPRYPKKVVLGESLKHPKAGRISFAELFSTAKIRRATILASVPWFLQDLGTYGIGMFTPTILAASVGVANPDATNLSDVINQDMLGAKGAAVIDLLLVVGIVAAVIFADSIGRIKLQIFGFIGCAIGLFIASNSVYSTCTTKIALIFTGFIIFNFMTNLGPNAMTYLIAGEVFPTRFRGVGAGFAASFAKIGAVTTAYLFPILLKHIGTSTLLYILVGTSLVGAFVTWRFSIETKGCNLEQIE